MNVEYCRWWSPRLSQEMELKVYGHGGKPFIVFPAQAGTFYEYENFGMVRDACQASIDAGRITLVAVDSIDTQSWCNWYLHPGDRARRHNDYDRYIIDEVVPFVRGRGCTSEIGATGCSMGGYHAANFFFRHPDVFDTMISLSGLMQLSLFLGDAADEDIYFNTPLAYLPGLTDPWYIERYRRSNIIICAGQGAWDEDMLADARALETILQAKGIPAWIDIWGQDVSHDWPWWRRQMPYFLHHLGL